MSKLSTRPDSDSAATQKWAERLDRFRSGHYKIAEFCAAEGVSVSNFDLWRRRLNSPVPSPAINSPVVVPLELVLPSGAIVRLPGLTIPTVIGTHPASHVRRWAVARLGVASGTFELVSTLKSRAPPRDSHVAYTSFR